MLKIIHTWEKQPDYKNILISVPFVEIGIETAKRNELDVYGYLLYLLTVLPEWGSEPSDEQIDSAMPWSSSLPDYCKQTYSEIQSPTASDTNNG